jgi:hypothetical protein
MASRHTPVGLPGMVKVTCVAVITGLAWIPAEATPAVPSTEPATRTVASEYASRRMKHSPFEGRWPNDPVWVMRGGRPARTLAVL